MVRRGVRSAISESENGVGRTGRFFAEEKTTRRGPGVLSKEARYLCLRRLQPRKAKEIFKDGERKYDSVMRAKQHAR